MVFCIFKHINEHKRFIDHSGDMNLALDECKGNCRVLVGSNIDSGPFALTHIDLENFYQHASSTDSTNDITNLALDDCKDNCQVLSSDNDSDIDSGPFALTHIDLESFHEHKSSKDSTNDITNLALDECKDNCQVLSSNEDSDIDRGPFALTHIDLENFHERKSSTDSTNDITNLALDECKDNCQVLSSKEDSDIDSGPFALDHIDWENFHDNNFMLY